MSGYFAEEYGSHVHLHADARGILKHQNRAWGSDTPLAELNHCYTLLVNEFTKFHISRDWVPYKSENRERINGFRVTDMFDLAGHVYKVLESEGGHVPGQVFFVSYDSGLIFTSDYLYLSKAWTQRNGKY